MPRVFLCRADQVGSEGIARIEIPHRPPLAVYRLGGQFHATDDSCTHGEASLAEGEIVDGQIVCPLHGGMFDIRTGEAKCPPCVVPLRTYAVHVEGDDLFAEIE